VFTVDGYLTELVSIAFDLGQLFPFFFRQPQSPIGLTRMLNSGRWMRLDLHQKETLPYRFEYTNHATPNSANSRIRVGGGPFR
jgi:hypothetical protein